jgi:hypothetical protein
MTLRVTQNFPGWPIEWAVDCEHTEPPRDPNDDEEDEDLEDDEERDSDDDREPPVVREPDE